MSPRLSAMYDERAALLAKADVIVKRSKAAGGHWSAEDEQEFDRLHDAADAVLGRITAEKAAAPAGDRHRTAVESLSEPRRVAGGVVVGTVHGRPVVVAPDDPAAARAQADYRAAFDAYLRRGRASAALQTDAADAGGYLAPPQFVADLVHGLDDGQWFRRLARVRPPTAALKVTQPARLSLPQVVWGRELADPPADESARYGGYTLEPHYLTGSFEVGVQVTAGPGGEGVVRDEILTAVGAAEERAFVAGDGARKPVGLFHPFDQGVPASRDVVGPIDSLDTWVDTRLSLRAVYLRSPSLRWVMHRFALRVLAKLKDAAGAPVWTPAQRPGDQDHLHGVPIELSDDAPAGSGPNGTYQPSDYLAAIGDLKQYDVQDGLDFGVTRHVDGPYARRGLALYVVRRKVDGCPRVPEAFARLKVGS